MIYIGYPWIGKTTLSKERNNFIDLESSYFSPFSSAAPANYLTYCSLAMDLNNQNFNVFVSSHRQVTDYLVNSYKHIGQANELCIIYPAEDLEENWSRKAFERYLKDKSDKNKRALDRILEHYAEDIDYLKRLWCAKNSNSIEIAEMNYKLIDYIENNTFSS